MAFIAANEPWPTDKEIDVLVKRSGGYFIFAATALRFIDEEYYVPQEQLLKVLENDMDYSTFAKIDILYGQILSINPNTALLLRILGYVLVAQSPATGSKSALAPSMIEVLLELGPGKVLTTLRGLHSLLRIGASNQDDSIECPHGSFADFLSNPARAGKFYVDVAESHADITRRCLNLMKNYTTRTPSTQAVVYRFISRSWTFHFEHADKKGELMEVLHCIDTAQRGDILGRWITEGYGSYWECFDVPDEAIRVLHAERHYYRGHGRVKPSPRTSFGLPEWQSEHGQNHDAVADILDRLVFLRNSGYKKHFYALSETYPLVWKQVSQSIVTLLDISCFSLTLHADGALFRLLAIGAEVPVNIWHEIRKYTSYIQRQMQRGWGSDSSANRWLTGLTEFMKSPGDAGELYAHPATCHAYLADRCMALLPFKLVPQTQGANIPTR